VSWKLVRSAVNAALEAYRSEKNVLAFGKYFYRLLLRRGPGAIKRRIEARRSLAAASAEPSRFGTVPGQIAVAAVVGGVIGDNIIAARFLRDLIAACPKVVLDVYTSNVALGRWIYAAVPGVRNCYQDSVFGKLPAEYDAELEFGDTIRFRRARSELLEGEGERFCEVIRCIQQFFERHNKNIDPYNRDGVIAQELLYTYGTNRAAANHVIAGIAYGGDRYGLVADEAAVAKFALGEKRYVTVHNGFDVSQVTHSRIATKVYPRFAEVISEIRKLAPDLMFVQVGSSTSTPIEGTDLNLIGKTSLAEAAGLVKRAACHLDNEGGLVTVASCYGTPCCVVYGPSSADYFAYKGHIAVRPIECGGCWWIAKDWLSQCPRGLREPVCMYTQPPRRVAQAVLQLLAGHPPSSGVSMDALLQQ
jgi:ADP-heptose:LPS heptosyltransferase